MKILLLLILFTTNAFSLDCKKHPIFCKIKKLRPKISNEKALKMSNSLYVHSKKYQGDPILAVAIGMQETSLRDRHRTQRVIQFYEECDGNVCKESWRVVSGVSDVCMFQFHVDTIVAEKIDPVRLKNDMDYCIEQHFKLMKKKKKSCKKLKEESWSCYHSKTKSLREFYIENVERYL